MSRTNRSEICNYGLLRLNLHIAAYRLMNRTNRRVECHSVDRSIVNSYPGRSELVPTSPKLANRLSKQTPYRPLYITVISRLNAGSKPPIFKQTLGRFTEPPAPPRLIEIPALNCGRGHKDRLQLEM